MKEKGTRKYKSYRLCGNGEKDKQQRQNAWMLHRRDAIGSLSNDNADGNENGKKGIGLISKTTTFHVHHGFLYISLPSLPVDNVKVPEFTFVEDGNTRQQVSFLFLNFDTVL